MKTVNHSPGISAAIFAITGLVLFFTAGCTKTMNDQNGSGGPPVNEVYMQGTAFSPATLTVTAGTTVKWTNKDGIPHNVVSNTGAFTSSTIGTNEVFSFTFNSAGTYPYHCTFHSGMNGTVIVN